MRTYTLVITDADGQQYTSLSEFNDDVDAIKSSRSVVSERHRSIGIARGSGDEVEWLGVWDWTPGEPRWTPDE